MSLDFEKYVGKGVIGDVSTVVLYASGVNWKMASGISSPVKNRSKRQHHAHEYMSRIPGAATRPGAELKEQCKQVKSWYNRPRGPPTQQWAANRPRAPARLQAATRPPATCSPLAKTGPPLAIQNLFVLVAAPNIWTISRKWILVLRRNTPF